MSQTIAARDLEPGDIYKSRTPFGEVTYLVVGVDAGPKAACHSHPSSDGPRDCTASHAVIVHSLREYKGNVANWERVYAADESITFRSAE